MSSLTVLICWHASLGNKLYIAPNHEEHCEPSLSEKEDYGNNSNLAKQCQIKEEKKGVKEVNWS